MLNTQKTVKEKAVKFSDQQRPAHLFFKWRCMAQDKQPLRVIVRALALAKKTGFFKERPELFQEKGLTFEEMK